MVVLGLVLGSTLTLCDVVGLNTSMSQVRLCMGFWYVYIPTN